MEWPRYDGKKVADSFTSDSTTERSFKFPDPSDTLLCDCKPPKMKVLPPAQEWREVICDCGTWMVSPSGRRMRKKRGGAMTCNSNKCDCNQLEDTMTINNEDLERAKKVPLCALDTTPEQDEENIKSIALALYIARQEERQKSEERIRELEKNLAGLMSCMGIDLQREAFAKLNQDYEEEKAHADKLAEALKQVVSSDGVFLLTNPPKNKQTEIAKEALASHALRRKES